MISSTGTSVTTAGGTGTLYIDKTDDNYGIGENLTFNAAAANNIAIGSEALNNTSGDADENVGIGANALTELTIGDENVALGYRAMDGATTANRCVIIGADAGSEVMITNSGGSVPSYADGTVAIGFQSMYNLTSGAGNVAVGYNTGTAITTGTYNTALGHVAFDAGGMGASNPASHNVAIGNNAMGAVDEGDNDQSASHNIAIGTSALQGGILANTKDFQYNIAIGGYALDDTATNAQTGTIAIGYEALSDLTTGSVNLAIGYQALQHCVEGEANLAIGHGALGDWDADATVDGSVHNVMVGRNAGGGAWITAQSSYNVGIGNYVMDAAMNGALKNTAMGHNAATGIIDGDDNVAIGNEAGAAITSGSQNTCIGSDSASGAVGSTNQTAVGYGCTAVNTDNSVTLGNAAVTRIHMSQDADAVMYADGTINTSDERWKKNIEDSDLGLSFINSVRPVKYNFKSDKQNSKLKYGIVAQEVIEVLKAIDREDFAGIETDDPDRLGADYVQFVAPLIKAVQELSAQVEELKNKQ